MKALCFLAGLFLFSPVAIAQHRLQGRVTDEVGKALPGARVLLQGTAFSTETDGQGRFGLNNVPAGEVILSVSRSGMIARLIPLSIPLSRELIIALKPAVELDEIEVQAQQDDYGVSRLHTVEDMGIYEAKKTEVIRIDRVQGNLAANTARQIYAKIPGLNIWENEGAGLQLGIGGRGLDPNRTSNFNVRQNGYDISADALGYPESYYTPPALALSRIEIVRGAASLQYGTQFGGLLNFRLHEGPADSPFQWESWLTGGAFGFLNAFNSIGGSTEKLNYYACHDYNRADGWRPHSESAKHTAIGRVTYAVSKKITAGIEYTHSSYLAHQPGGLTDAQFKQDPSQSSRARNWFAVNWNLLAATLQYSPRMDLRFDYRVFYLDAGRDAVGNLSRIDRPDDPAVNRDLMTDDYRNYGMEARALKYFSTGKIRHIALAGIRYYKGLTIRKQGLADNGSDADFIFLHPQQLEGSDFRFPGQNLAAFAEDVIALSDRWSLTPGIRYEYIHTASEGYYRDTKRNLAGDILSDTSIRESRENTRSFVLGGLGISFKPGSRWELYGNISQNYRAINFNDIRVNVPSLRVDENIRDENGFNADIGIRGNTKALSMDASLFLLSYNNRIGNRLVTEPDPLFNNLVSRTIRLRTNIADAVITGAECYAELDWLALNTTQARKSKLSTFINAAYIYSQYIHSDDKAIQGKQVELAPPLNIKAGISFIRKKWSAGIQAGYVSTHFSDASNTPSDPPVPSAIEGTIPAYYVVDFFASCEYRVFRLKAGINNLGDARYFTRRASGYPGPGIIPSDPRNLYVSLGIRLSAPRRGQEKEK